MNVQTSSFLSHGDRCDADLYLPVDISNPPVVVMGHGFAAEKAFGLHDYANRFVAAGFAVFMFDYRGFGRSEGSPRQLVDPFRHLQDWAAAVAHVRTLAAVDGTQIAVWGSSFGGGHALVTAARDPQIKAVIAQVPYVDSLSTIPKIGLPSLLRLMPALFRDLGRMVFGRSPHTIKVYGRPTENAALNTPECYDGYRSIVPADSTWRNECPARILATFGVYRPIHATRRITAPVLLQIGEHDSLMHAPALQKMGRKMPNCEQVTYLIGHFDIYHGDHFEQAVRAQCDFLQQQFAPQLVAAS